MGACMSSNNEEVEQKKHSQAIDRQLEEDSRRLRRECKILLLGEHLRALLVDIEVAVADRLSFTSQVPARAESRRL